MLIFSRHFENLQAVDVLSGIAGDWRKITVRGNVKFSASGASLLLQPSVDGGLSWVNSGITTHIDQQAQPSTPTSRSVDSVWSGLISAGSSHPDHPADFEYEIPDPNAATPEKTWRSFGAAKNYDGNFYTNRIAGQFTGQIVNSLRLIPSSGTLSGWIEVLGERETDCIADDVFRVACSGASLTYSGGWIFPVQAKLQAQWPHKRVVVRNFGNPGANGTTETALLNIGNVLACKPDVAIIDHSAADSAYAVAGVSAWRMTCEMIDRLRGAGIEPMLLVTNPISAGGYPNLTAYYQQYRDIGIKKSCRVIDCYQTWVDLGTFATVGSDGIHPTPAANALVTVPAVYGALT